MTLKEIGGLVGGILAASAALFATFQWGVKIGTYDTTKSIDDPSKVERVRLYGYWNDFDQKQNSYTGSDVLDLAIAPSKKTGMIEVVQGKSTGQTISTQGQKVDKEWGMYGFRVGDLFVGSFYTTAPQAQSAGSFSLHRKGSDSYVGFWMGRDNITGRPLLAPYVLLDTQLTVNEAKRKYPELLEPATFRESKTATERPR